jgi:hypothetical protein
MILKKKPSQEYNDVAIEERKTLALFTTQREGTCEKIDYINSL